MSPPCGKRGRLKWVQLRFHQRSGDPISSLPVAGVAPVRAGSEVWSLSVWRGGMDEVGPGFLPVLGV